MDAGALGSVQTSTVFSPWRGAHAHHTWTQQLLYHPHVHCLVTGGGVPDDGADWRPARQAFLVPVRALAKLVRGKLRAGLIGAGAKLLWRFPVLGQAVGDQKIDEIIACWYPLHRNFLELYDAPGAEENSGARACASNMR